jgi:hypothetical protein
MRWLAWYSALVAVASVAVFDTTASAALRGRRRCGCSDPGMTYTYTANYAVPPAAATAATPSRDCLTGSWTELQVVLEPSYGTEKRTVCLTSYKNEDRSRAVSGYKTVPITEERVRVSTVMVPRTETKTVDFTSQVAVQSQEQKSYRIKVPVWTDQEETYLVKVPVLKEVPETYTVKVPVLRDAQFTYTVNVPQPVTRTGTRTVSNVVPVVKTHTVNYCLPTTQTSSTSVDRGHWENQMYQVSAGRGRAPTMAQRRVWVPNIVQEDNTSVVSQQQSTQVEYLVYEQHYDTVPYECVCIEYRPENRTGTKQEVVYQDETRTRMRTAVDYQDENRSRIKKVLTFQEEDRTENYPIVTYRPQRETKEVSYTVYVPETKTETYTVTREEQVPDYRIENYTVRVAVPEVKEVDVQVTRMIPKVVSVTINPCGGPMNQTGQPRPVAVVPVSQRYEASPPPHCCGGGGAE